MSGSNIDAVTDLLAGTTIDELSFAGKGLKLDTEEDAKEIVDALNNTKTVRSLNMEGNTLGVDAAKSIAKALEKHPEFQRAKWSDMFTGRLKSEIPQALRYLGGAMMLCETKLVELNLSDNAFGPNGMEGLTEFLKSSSCYTLRELRLNNNGLGISGGKMLAKALLECHKNSCAVSSPLSLKVFISGRNRLENEGATVLAEAFKAIGTLEEVSMPQNGINHPGITALAQAFAVNSNLKFINLNDNTFTEKGAQAMAESLPKLQDLQVLNFGDCLVRTNGAKALAKSLKDGHQNLNELHLGFNEITKAGAIAVADCLRNKTNLNKVDLDGNQFGEEGKDAVREEFDKIGKLDILESLSDDEGTDEEEEDDEDEDEQAEERPAATSNGMPGVVLQSVTVEEFLKSPSRNGLIGMGSDRGQLVLNHIGKDADADTSLETMMKVCSVVGVNDDQAKEAACQCADSILSNLLKNSTSESQQYELSNALVVHLGLIKNEDKRTAVEDLNGPFIVLSHVVQQKYFPKSMREVLNMFVSVPKKKFSSCTVPRDELLKVLNRLY